MSLLKKNLFAKAQAETGRMRGFLSVRCNSGSAVNGAKARRRSAAAGNRCSSLELMAEEDGFEAAGAESERARATL